MDFAKQVLLVDVRELACTDRHGILLMSNVQVTHEVVIPPTTARNFCPFGPVEDHPENIPMVASVNCLQKNGQMIANA